MPSSRRASVWDWTLAIFIAANLVWTTLCLGGFRTETQLVSRALTAGALALWCLQQALVPASEPRRRLHPAGWWLLPFLVYALANALWLAPMRWLGLADWFHWAELMAMFWLVLNGLPSRGPRRFVRATLALVGVVAVALAVYQRFVEPDWLMLGRTQAPQFIGRASGPFGIPNSLAALLLLLIPPAIAGALAPERAPRPRLTVALLALVYLFGLVLTISRGAWLSLGLALALWPLVEPGRRWRWRVGVAGGLAAGVLAVGATLYASLPGVRARFDALVADAGERTRPIMWRGAWQLFQDSPVVGTGAGSYNVLFERHRPEGFRDEPRWAHNDYLNTLSDHGAVGFLLLFGAAVAVAVLTLRRQRQGTDAERAAFLNRGRLMGLAAFAFSLFIDFHLKIPALSLAVAVCAGDWVRCAWPVEERRRGAGGRVAAGVMSVAVLTFLVAVILPRHRAEALRHDTRRQLDRLADRPLEREREEQLLREAVAVFARATELDPGNGQAWADRAYAIALLARHDRGPRVESGREAEAAARRALAMGASVPEFWWRLGVGLDIQGRWTEAGAAFARAVELAPHSALSWYYQAYHYSLKPATRPLARAAVVTCLRLDPGNRAAETLRENLVARQ